MSHLRAPSRTSEWLKRREASGQGPCTFVFHRLNVRFRCLTLVKSQRYGWRVWFFSADSSLQLSVSRSFRLRPKTTWMRLCSGLSQQMSLFMCRLSFLCKPNCRFLCLWQSILYPRLLIPGFTSTEFIHVQVNLSPFPINLEHFFFFLSNNNHTRMLTETTSL